MNNIFIKTLPSEIYSGYIQAWSLSLPTVRCVAAAEAWDSTGLTMPPWTQCEPSGSRSSYTVNLLSQRSAELPIATWLLSEITCSPVFAPESPFRHRMDFEENQPSCHCCVPGARMPGAQCLSARCPSAQCMGPECPMPGAQVPECPGGRCPSAQCPVPECPAEMHRQVPRACRAAVKTQLWSDVSREPRAHWIRAHPLETPECWERKRKHPQSLFAESGHENDSKKGVKKSKNHH